jgi:SecD/SecF fusion protein
MDKNAIWKWLILFVLIVFSSMAVLPIKDKVNLGIDLQGGTSFTVQIDRAALLERLKTELPDEWKELSAEDEVKKLDEELRWAQDQALEVLRNRVDGLGISEPIIYKEKSDRIVIQLPGVGEEKRIEAENAIRKPAYLEFRLVHKDNDNLVKDLFDRAVVPSGYKLYQSGDRRFYMRDKNAVSDEQMDKAYRKRMLKFEAPPAYHFLLERRDEGTQEVFVPYFVDRWPQLTGDYLKTANVNFGQVGQPVVYLEFDNRGRDKFSTLTSDYSPNGAKNLDSDVGRQLAVVLDGTLYSAPNLIEPIHTGSAQITGSFTRQEARFLSNILRAGSLRAPVEVVEKRVVDPSLGADSIRSGTRAVLYGAIGVVGFMLIYYMVSGLVANLALMLNMVLLPLGMILAAGFLGIFSKDVVSSGPIGLPVLTLPGIAGILLTIGMAVDANVLIFERIREETRSGKRLWPAIVAGYERAFVTILDANLTTMLVGVILFIFGSGPIRGFAVTLCAGIAVSMYTALIVTRMIFQLLAEKTPLKTLKMLSVIHDPAFKFIDKRAIAGIVSVIVIASSWSFMIWRGVQDPTQIMNVDLTGGTSVQYLLGSREQKPGVEAIRAALATVGKEDALIQYQAEMDLGGKEYLVVKTGYAPGADQDTVTRISETLMATFPSAGFTVAAEDKIGSQIGGEMKSRALKAMLIALLGIVCYITLRFEFGFAIGAILALAHDVLITVGIYTALGRQLSLPVVAALLTIVGYSVNDTIVVFDRIREDLRLVRDRDFAGICDLSINHTLSRTLLTSLTTLLVVVTLLIFGGGAINDFALTLCIGVVVGTYSSIFVATPTVLLYHKGKKPELSAKPVS